VLQQELGLRFTPIVNESYIVDDNFLPQDRDSFTEDAPSNETSKTFSVLDVIKSEDEMSVKLTA
jgi:hypothetical protein